MSQWYVSKNGKALGPFSEEEMAAKIKNHELNHLDLVYKTGLAEWQTLNQMDELKKFFQKEKTVSKKNKSEAAEWVVLKKGKSEKGSEYQQLGPFTEDQVLELIDQGEVRFSDFGWKKGLETWVKISQLDPFSKPLPSSSQIDHSIYEETSPNFKVDTLTDVEKRSLTRLVKIEHFDHTLKEENAVKKTPLLNDDFATQTDHQLKASGVSISETDDKINLWSLEPPEQSSVTGSDVDLDKTVVATKKPMLQKQKTKESAQHKKSEIKKDKTKKVRSKPKNQSKGPLLSYDVKLWLAACGVFVIAATFLYLSLTPTEREITYEKPLVSSVVDKSDNEVITDVAEKKSEIYQRMEKLKENIKEVQNIPEEPKPKPKVEARVSPKVPVEQKVSIKKEKTVVTVTKRPEKVVAAVPKKVAKIVPTKSQSAPVKSKKVSKAEPVSNLARGSAKTKSFYVQRDRKALFYSSLKAETLAVEIQRQFIKLKKNKSAWSQFYGGWKKKVRISLASDIKNYPVKSEKYAYPKIIESFKKDYDLFYKYGEAFNAKVIGGRVPSGAPADLQKVFSRYKSQAQGLENK